MTEAAGDRVIGGRYCLGEQLGAGGMGTVYRATDRQTGDVVAVKALRPQLLVDDPLLLERFIREGDVLRRLNHPNIVNMLDSIADGDRHYLVMEYVGGGSLQNLLRAQPGGLPTRRVLEIALDLADALTRAHRLDIIHRDIKTANILLADDGTPRLSDFGIARVGESTITRTGAVMGTMAYMPPEAFSGGEFDRRSDIWAFGVVLYEMVCGRRPFASGQMPEMIAAILHDPLPDILEYRHDVPFPLIALINEMLQKDKDLRIASVRQVGLDLETIMEQVNATEAESPGSAETEFDYDGPVIQPSRFNTPTPMVAQGMLTTLDEATYTPLTAPVLATETAVEREPDALTGQDVPEMESVPPGGAVQSGKRLTGRVWGGVAGGVLLLLVVAAVAGWLFFNRPVLVEPVGSGEHMVLVAALEPIGVEKRDVARFIVDDLRQKLEVSVPFSTMRVRAYPRVVTSTEQARQVAEVNGATVIVWGNYDDEFIQVNVDVGVLTGFPHIQVDRDMIDRIANVRIRMEDERQQSIAPDVLSTWIAMQNADGAGFEAVRTIAVLDQILQVNDHTVEVLGQSVGAHGHRYFTSLTTDPAYALEEVDACIELDPGNPLLYMSRHAPLYRLGRLDGMRDDALTAIRLGPDDWALPYYVLGNYAYFTNDFEQALDYYGQIIDMRPDDWFPYTFRGALYYLMGDYEQARVDLEQSVALGPNTNFPYPMLAMLALRDGQIDEAKAQIATVLRDFPDPMFGTRVVEALFGPDTKIILAPIFSAFGNLVLERYRDVIDDVEVALTIDDQLSDLYLMEGFAYCNTQAYEEAEAAYSQGIAVDPEFIALYALRAEVRLRQNDMIGALADLAVVRTSDLADEFADLIAGAQSGAITCENFFAVD